MAEPYARPTATAMSEKQTEVSTALSNGDREPGLTGEPTANKPDKSFTTLSAMGLGYSISGTATGLVISIASVVPYGGSPLFFFGFLLMSVVALCIATTLGEFVSIWPHPGGQYYWVSQLAPSQSRRFLSYMTAIVSWSSAVCISASCLLAASMNTFNMVSLAKPDFEAKPWMNFLLYQAYNLLFFGLNCFESSLPSFGRLVLFFMVSVNIVIVVTMFAQGGEITSAEGFFTDYSNQSGWPDGVAFFIGINAINWSYSCLDSITHLAEEIPKPRENIPRALIWTIAFSFLSGLAVILAMFLTSQNIIEQSSSLSMFYHVTNDNLAAALGLQSLASIAAYLAIVGIHSWQARIAWALARDGGLPFSRYLGRIAPSPYRAPVWAHTWSASWSALCGLLYLASQHAFASFTGAGLILQYATYALPICLLLQKGRHTVDHGPFWFPRLGPICNIVTFVWFLIALVFYSLPFSRPMVLESFNYVPAVLGVFIIYALGYWFLFGRNHYVSPHGLVLED